MKWKTLSSELVFKHRHFKVRKDIVDVPDVGKKEWLYWDSNDTVIIVAYKDGKFLMIKQYRFAYQEEVYEFPAGYLDDGETPEEGARREFEEESGYKAGKMEYLGAIHETAQLNRNLHFFFTEEFTRTQQNLDTGERGFEKIDVEFIDYEDVEKMAKANKLGFLCSMLAFYLVKEKIGK